MLILNKGMIPDSRESVVRIVRAAHPRMPGTLRVLKNTANLITRRHSHGMPTWALVWTQGPSSRRKWAAIVQDAAFPAFFTLVLSSKHGGFVSHGWQKRIHMPTGSRALMRFIDDARGHLSG